MGLNWSYKLIKWFLVLMIAISIFLSSLIWVQSSRTSVGNYSDSTATTIKEFNPKEVFSPVRLVRHLPDAELLYTNRESIMQKATEELSKLSYGELRQATIPTNKKYQALMAEKGTIELMFSDSLLLDYFLSIYGFDLVAEDDLLFNRIILDYQDGTLSFFNDETHEVWTADYQGSLTKFRELILDDTTYYYEVESHNNYNDTVFYNISTDIKLKKYSYILETQAYSVFSKLLFDPSQDIIPSDDTSKNLYFSTPNGQNLSVANETGVIQFDDPLVESTEEKNSESLHIYEKTFAYLNKLGRMIGTVHYFENNNNQIVYRQYVEGYPIFSEYERGRVTISQMNQEMTMLMNQNTIQVPIPLDEEVTVAQPTVIMEQLKNAGVDFNQVTGMQIGYTWLNEHDKDKPIVNLSPEWYIKYEGVWDTVADVLQKVSQGGDL